MGLYDDSGTYYVTGATWSSVSLGLGFISSMAAVQRRVSIWNYRSFARSHPAFPDRVRILTELRKTQPDLEDLQSASGNARARVARGRTVSGKIIELLAAGVLERKVADELGLTPGYGPARSRVPANASPRNSQF